MPNIEVPLGVSSTDLKGIVSAGIDRGGLDLEDISRYTSLRGDGHVTVHYGRGLLPAQGVGGRTEAAIVRHLDIRLHATVGVHTAVAPIEIDTGLCFRALVCAGLALINVLAEACGQQLVALWAVAREATWLVNTAVLAEVTGVAALINITAGEAIPVQFVALMAATQEGPIGVEAALLAWSPHVTFVHIHTGAVVGPQLEAWFALAAKGARQVHTAMLAVAVAALVYIHTFRPNLAVTIRAGALVRTRQVVALLAGAAVVQGLSTLVHVHTALLLIRLIAWWAGVRVLNRWHWWWWALAMQVVDDGSRARQAQVAPIVVDAFHFPLAGLGDGQALVDIPAVLAVGVPLIAICAFRVAVGLLRILGRRCPQEQQQQRPEQ